MEGRTDKLSNDGVSANVGYIGNLGATVVIGELSRVRLMAKHKH